jgi:HSP20 family protein
MDVTKTETRTPAPTGDSRPPAALSPFLSLREDFDRLFDNLFLTPLSRRLLDVDPLRRRGLLVSDLTPRMDVVETDSAIEVSAELPGIAEKDIDLSIAKGLVTIRGEKKAEHEEEQGDYHLSERSFGSFVRSFRLPENVVEDRVEATFDKGVLTITLPKAESATSARKKIEVKAKH